MALCASAHLCSTVKLTHSPTQTGMSKIYSYCFAESRAHARQRLHRAQTGNNTKSAYQQDSDSDDDALTLLLLLCWRTLSTKLHRPRGRTAPTIFAPFKFINSTRAHFHTGQSVRTRFTVHQTRARLVSVSYASPVRRRRIQTRTQKRRATRWNTRHSANMVRVHLLGWSS